VLAVGDTAPETNLWDATDPNTPRRIAGPLAGPPGPIQRLDITAAGTELAASGEGDGVFRWDISNPERPRRLPIIQSDTVSWGLAYSPDGTRLAFGQDTGQVRIWELAPRPSEIGRVRIGTREIYTVAFSPEGDTLAAGAQNGELHAWDVTTPGAPRELALP
jgi:WD40 repeat protein